MPDTTPTPAIALSAPVLTRWLRLAQAVAEASQDLVDCLNVFPVPDADTGTNFLLTIRAAADALALLPQRPDVAQTARAAADGAVRGARGNSGLLLSQALAALADVSAQAPDPRGLRPVELVHAYERMAKDTRAAVSRPVDGTLLTVAQDAAIAARGALQDPKATPSLASVAAAAALGAQESVVETAGLGHGPVDAGGAALMLLFTALSDAVAAGPGHPGGETPQAAAATAAPLTDVAHQMLLELAAGGITHGAEQVEGSSTGEFEVMYLLEATAAQAAELRSTLEQIGDSVGVVGTPDALGVGLFQVHVHTDTPRAALPRSGSVRQVCVHHLHRTALVQDAPTAEPPLPRGHRNPGASVVSFERLAAHRRKAGEAAGPAPRSTARPGIGVIACTRAPGLIEQLARTGAVVVLNPQREGIVRAAGDLGTSQVLVLPCDAASATQAHEAARHLQARSAVSCVAGPGGERSRGTLPAAGSPALQLLVCDTNDEAGVLAAAVTVAGHVNTDTLGEATARAASAAAAVRTIALSGEQAEPDAVAAALANALRHGVELVTVILGRDAAPDIGATVNSAVSSSAYGHGFYDVEVVIHAGGQPAPDVLIAVE
ncbi:DAK2 domain fusion protein YloV [Actinomyces bovis]|uniref:DAK2 domain fusion protein YloV n=1 Tax=Actinomyces bovis TaxID=1658 RepID=A0ABY1VLG7_9ACTO|nr:DAK2 domain-containing protein [Actinomyces bovis]SPT52597.1 DAK2 domain fusion protein YloV [Actinomyces bovis]VEG54402.1 DAK2 domain fusion protein YloV [Actinomyces israelii]